MSDNRDRSKRRVITRDEFLARTENNRFVVEPEMVITPAVAALARQRGIEIVSAGPAGTPMGIDSRMIVEMVTQVLDELQHESVEAAPAGFTDRPKLYNSLGRDVESRAAGNRAVVASTGFNRPGIVAMLTHTIAQLGVDILDISQTLVSDFFTMIIVADLEGVKERGLTFRQFKDELTASARALGIEIMVVHEDILNAMHRI